jgi:poly(ADP-ribose) glycohydrolase ARH3
MDRLESKFVGCLIGAAIGDALGATREGATDFQEVTALGPRYTDDTAMMIGVAESLIESGTFHYEDMATRFIQNYEREPWRRYSAGAPRIFRMMQNGRLWFGMLDREVYPGGSIGNGAAMRVAPVGLFYHDDPRELRDSSYQSGGITHSTELALEGAAIQACAVALAVQCRSVNRDSHAFLTRLREFTINEEYRTALDLIGRLLERETAREEILTYLGNSAEAFHSVPTAIYSFLSQHDFQSAVTYAVSLGGDADTIGAMTGAIAGACFGIEGIPAIWKYSVENREFLEQLGKRLREVWEEERVR